MSEDDLLDMHYFLTEDDFDDEDEEGSEGFYLSSRKYGSPRDCGG